MGLTNGCQEQRSQTGSTGPPEEMPGVVQSQEFDQDRSSIGDGFDKRLSRAEESDWLDRSSRRDGVVRRGQECDQGRSSRADEVDKRLSRAEESDWLDRSSRRDGVVR